ncbi:MAG TPA: C4-type zinc ribbon domain-containing protein [Gemmataceae bacterium]|nr:C4-type zinc ribbon domain-containing protein [Gemmataceae bacterium]
MSGPAVTFREIHRLRRFTSDLREQIDRVPRQQKIQQAKVARQEEIQRATQDAIKHIKVEIHSKEVTLKTTHGQIDKYQKQLNESGSKKEYDALQHEISDARATCQRLEEEILTGIADSEEKAAQLPELEKAVRLAKDEYAKYEAGIQERLTNLQSQLAEAQKQLTEQELAIPPNIRVQYARIVASMGHDALAPVQGRTCAACYTEITAQQYNELQQEMVVLCKSCGRILYLPQ